MQSISRQGKVSALVDNYGQVIVDGAHHVSAVTFDAILQRTKAKYVLGLTATPIRRDGYQPIIFMQCGPIRYKALSPSGTLYALAVVRQTRHTQIDLPVDAPLQDVFRQLTNDQTRTDIIAAGIRASFEQRPKLPVLPPTLTNP